MKPSLVPSRLIILAMLLVLATLLIALADVATNWSGPNPVTLAGLDRTTTNGVNILTNSLWILYPKSSPNVNDQISYSIGDDQGGWRYPVKVSEFSAKISIPGVLGVRHALLLNGVRAVTVQAVLSRTFRGGGDPAGGAQAPAACSG